MAFIGKDVPMPDTEAAKPAKKKKLMIALIVVLSVIFIAYWVMVYFLVDAALVPSFMKKLDSFSEVTEKSVSEQQHTSDIQDNHKKAVKETNEWLKTVKHQKYTTKSDDGYDLVAMTFEPDAASGSAVAVSGGDGHDWVLILHGYTGWKEEMYPFAREYCKRGYHAMVPDLRCQGESDGDFIGMGYTDSFDCMKWIQGILKIDPQARIVLHGQSMGAATALIMSGRSDLPDCVKAIVSDCSYTDAYAMFRSKINDWFSLPAFPLVDSARLVLMLRGGYDLSRASAINAVEKSHTPTLFIHGADDKMISADMTRDLYDACASEKKELLIVDGAGHAQAQDKDPDRYYGKIFDFIKEAKDTEAVSSSSAVSQAAVKPSPTETAATEKPPSPIKTIDPNRYVHGSEGYFNLEDAGVPVHLRTQSGGTCWLFAAATSMETGYEMTNHREVEIEPLDLLDKIYGEDKKEGYFIKGANPKDLGGFSFGVVHALSNGFDKHVLDRGIQIPDKKRETLKEYIREYGGVYIAIPTENASKYGCFNGYSTLRYVYDEEHCDHAICVVGWDDHFPKEYFSEEASQDGAWITTNSNSNGDYFYVSYDTTIDYTSDVPTAMSISDAYTGVATHDCGSDYRRSIKMDDVSTANVFHESGTLGAIGTYSTVKDQDISIKIYDSKFEKCLYTQKGHLSEIGYQVIELAMPVEVDDYAIAITYSGGEAPVEGKGDRDDHIVFKTTSKKGESFVKIGKRWYDTHEKSTLKRLGRKDKLNNCCIKGLYI